MQILRLSLLLIVLLSLTVHVLCTDKYSRGDFPPDFIFGAGTSAYQVEGAADEDGRSPSIWDKFAHDGFYPYGENGDVAVDEYHKYKEDVQLMVQTGLEGYRFSISWSRLIPTGRGPVNPMGLEYYNNLINELVRNGIQPHVSLYNYDHPMALEDEYGGWVNRQIVKDFTAYAEVCFREFGDRVSYWATINEPNIFAVGGYDQGITPPGRCSPPFGIVNCAKGNSSREPYVAGYHMLLAHASTVKLYRKKYQSKQQGLVGLTLYAPGLAPSSNSTEDAAATERAKAFFYGWFLDPLTYGDYPAIMKENAGSRLPLLSDSESKLVKGAFDFIGLIHYMIFQVQDDSKSMTSENRDFSADMGAKTSVDFSNSSSFLFPKAPWGLAKVLDYFKETYGNPPVYIHENGEMTLHKSSLLDTTRVEYIHAYIGSLLDAIRNGANAKGYFVWSFVDVFELLTAYEASFGLYYVDLDDPELKRYPKLSSHWYSHFLKGGCVSSQGIIQLNKEFSASPHAKFSS